LGEALEGGWRDLAGLVDESPGVDWETRAEDLEEGWGLDWETRVEVLEGGCRELVEGSVEGGSVEVGEMLGEPSEVGGLGETGGDHGGGFGSGPGKDSSMKNFTSFSKRNSRN
jgi:hypothetical protein